MTLTRRQAQILAMFLDGDTGRVIAKRLNISPGTIAPTLKQASRKLGAGGIGREKLRRAVAQRGVDLSEHVSRHRGKGLTGESE